MFQFSAKVTIGTLGPWQNRITGELERQLPGAAVSYAPLPNGAVALLVVWLGFENVAAATREEQVRNALETTLGMEPVRLLSSIHALTPAELQDMDRREKFRVIVAALQARLSGDIGYTIYETPEPFTVIAEPPDGITSLTITFTPEYLDRLGRLDINATAGRLYGDGVFAFLNTAHGRRKIAVAPDGINEAPR